jgi:hypothetical protein
MNSKNWNLISFTLLALIAVLSPHSKAYAQGGSGHVGGGGDAAVEMRIDEIRNDLLKWIQDGGAQALTLPADLTYSQYQSSMNGVLQAQKVVVTGIPTAQENPNDDELNTTVSGQPKTCKGFLSARDTKLHILCNVERFKALTEAEQYRQIHHEYAGLVGVEKNEGAASDYFLSQQITDSLTLQPTLRLAVRSASHVCPSGQLFVYGSGCLLQHPENGYAYASMRFTLYLDQAFQNRVQVGSPIDAVLAVSDNPIFCGFTFENGQTLNCIQSGYFWGTTQRLDFLGVDQSQTKSFLRLIGVIESDIAQISGPNVLPIFGDSSNIHFGVPDLRMGGNFNTTLQVSTDGSRSYLLKIELLTNP